MEAAGQARAAKILDDVVTEVSELLYPPTPAFQADGLHPGGPPRLHVKAAVSDKSNRLRGHPKGLGAGQDMARVGLPESDIPGNDGLKLKIEPGQDLVHIDLSVVGHDARRQPPLLEVI